ncbi:MAG: hypothetical protein ACC645_07840 [Pirellulales bacterium]
MRPWFFAILLVVLPAYTMPVEVQIERSGETTATIDDIQLDTISSGYDGKTCWVHSRAGTIPGERPIVVLTNRSQL